MLDEIKITTALRRLAILESQPFRTPQELLEWDCLRRWVLEDPDLLKQYREQEYFSRMEEITKKQLRPKAPPSFISKVWSRLFPRH